MPVSVTHLRALPEHSHEEHELLELQHAIAVKVDLLHLLLDVRAARRDVELNGTDGDVEPPQSRRRSSSSSSRTRRRRAKQPAAKEDDKRPQQTREGARATEEVRWKRSKSDTRGKQEEERERQRPEDGWGPSLL